MICKECGTEFMEGLFCPECGTKCIEEKNQPENVIVQQGTETEENGIDQSDKKQPNQRNDEERKIKKINRKAIISLITGAVSWVSILTVVIPFICGIWAVIDGIKALKGKTKYKKCAIFGIILGITVLAFIIWVAVYPS